MKTPWTRKEPLFQVRSMQMAEPVIFDLILRRAPHPDTRASGKVDRMSLASAGAVALADELAKVLPEILRPANRTAPSRRSFT